MGEFLAMGGYAGYVWPAIGLTLAVIGALLAQSLRAMRTAEAQQAQLEAGRTRRPQAP